MWNRLSFRNKKLVLIAGTALFLYLSYSLLFNRLIEAASAHRQLKADRQALAQLNTSYPNTERKNAYYADVLNIYKVKKVGFENRLWQSISGIAMAKV